MRLDPLPQPPGERVVWEETQACQAERLRGLPEAVQFVQLIPGVGIPEIVSPDPTTSTSIFSHRRICLCIKYDPLLVQMHADA